MKIIAIFCFVSLLALAGCGTADIPRSNVQANSTPDNSSAATSASLIEEKSSATGLLATPTDAYMTIYEARKNKDLDALERALSDDTIEFFTKMGEEEGRSLEDMLRELAERPQADKAEARNEKITGNTATIEYLDEKGKWKRMDFEKVGNEWKQAILKGGGPTETKKP
jgi:hypothetical protein